MVLPHPVVAFQGFLIRVEQVMVGGDSTACMDMFQGLELRDFNFPQLLRIADQRHHFFFPLRVQPLPVGVIVKGALLEFLCAAGNFVWISHSVSADVDAAVDDSIVDPQRCRQAMHSRVVCAQSTICGLGSDCVEEAHGRREMHGVVEPEALVILRGELHVVRISSLGLFGSRDHFKRAWKRKALGFDHCAHLRAPVGPFQSTPFGATV